MELSIKATPFKVRDLVDLKREKRLFLPDLQRGFVWDAERVRMLFDSLLRRYPVGSILLWKPAWKDEEPPVNVRAWDIFPPNSTLSAGEPEPVGAPKPGSIFVLDGQQRLTSLFRVIFDSRKPGRAENDPNLLVSLSRDEEWREEPFLYRSRQIRREDERKGLIVPAAVLFAGVRDGHVNGAESIAVSKAVASWLSADQAEFFSTLDRANEIRNAILNAEIVAYEIDTEAEDESVIEIFGRLNQQAVRLTPADLAAARLTGKMKNFRVKASTALKSTGFAGFSVEEGDEKANYGGFVDTDLLVRTAMALATGGTVKYRDAEKGKKIDEIYGKIEPRWDHAVASLEYSIGIFRSSGIPSGSWIPYRYTLLIPAIAQASNQSRSADDWLGWAIAASLWGSYGGSAETKVQSDARQAIKGNWDGLWQSLRSHAKRRETLIPEPEDISAGLVQTSGIHLAELVRFFREDARSFYGERFRATTQDLDVHHIFPRAMFTGVGRIPRETSGIPDRLGNLTILTAADNRSIGAREPSEYLPTLDAGTLEAHCIPTDRDLWKWERYIDFCAARENLLAEKIRALLSALHVP